MSANKVTAVSVAGVAAVAATVAARRALVLITVSGSSMSPTYTDGEKLLVRRSSPQVGDVVVFRHPQLSRSARKGSATAGATTRPDVDWMVKRVVAVPGDLVPEEFLRAVRAAEPQPVVPFGHLLVRGDNPRSLDSRHFGYVPAADVLGVAVRRRPAG
ncbi:MAG: signal peptidase I [Catenulispora sp.]|nr:signal peptidase I [Catenulispora sp.]